MAALAVAIGLAVVLSIAASVVRVVANRRRMDGMGEGMGRRWPPLVVV